MTQYSWYGVMSRIRFDGAGGGFLNSPPTNFNCVAWQFAMSSASTSKKDKKSRDRDSALKNPGSTPEIGASSLSYTECVWFEVVCTLLHWEFYLLLE